MTWTNNFRADLYQKHHKAEHPSFWTRYQACSSEDKATFFENQTPFQSTMIPHINSGLNIMPTTLTIHSSIVDVLISDMFFHPDEHGGVTQAAVLKLSFKKRIITKLQYRTQYNSNWLWHILAMEYLFDNVKIL